MFQENVIREIHFTGGSISVWTPNPYLPLKPYYNHEKKFKTTAYYKVQNTKPPIKLSTIKAYYMLICQTMWNTGNSRFGD
jgi:hypothetical protein